MVKSVFENFCQETTAHGFLRIGDPERRLWARVCWILVLLAFTAVFGWQAKLLVERYLRYETTVNTELTTEDRLIFPTITLCNINPYQKDRLPRDSGITRYMMLVKNISDMQYTGQMQDMCQSDDPVILLFCANMTDPRYNTTPWNTQATGATEPISTMANAETTTATGTIAPEIPTSTGQGAIRDPGPQAGGPNRAGQALDGHGGNDSESSFRQSIETFRDGGGPALHPENLGSKMSWLLMENKAFRDIGVLAAMNQDGYEDALQPEDDFVQDCRFNTGPCHGIRKDQHPWYGACYSFNPLGNYSSIRPGPLYGLTVQLHVNTSQYLPCIFMTGVRIGINQAYQMPFPEIDGVFAPVGASTAVSVTVVETQRKGPPYGDCLMDSENLNRTDVYYYSTNYTLNGCLNTCLQRQIVKNCGCWSFAYPKPPGNNTVPLCANAGQTMCASVQEMSTADNCSCTPLCNDLDYKTTISHSVWPAQEKRCPPGPMCTSFGASAYAKENQLKLQVYFESLTKFSYIESEAYTFLSLISDFGGQLGLWVGASFCTMIELLSFAVSLITACCGCNHQNVEKRQTNDPKQGYALDTSRVRSMSLPPPKHTVYPRMVDMYG